MADGFLEQRMHDFEKRRDAWRKARRQTGRKPVTRTVERPDDEAL